MFPLHEEFRRGPRSLTFTTLQAIVEHYQQAFWHLSLLPPLAGSFGWRTLSDGLKGLGRKGHCGTLSSTLWRQRLLHGSIRTHYPSKADLQGGYLSGNRLLNFLFPFLGKNKLDFFANLFAIRSLIYWLQNLLSFRSCYRKSRHMMPLWFCCLLVVLWFTFFFPFGNGT